MKLLKRILAFLWFCQSWSLSATEFKEAEITTIKNTVQHDAGAGAAPAKVNEKIKEKSKVSTAAASMAELMFADTSITRMGANTQFSFQSKERLVKLEQGTVLVHTPPGNGGATVDCGGVTGAVSGTTFMVSRDSSGSVMFVLLEGQGGLRVTVGGESKVIRAGQAASVGSETVKEAKSSPLADSSAGASGQAKDDRTPGGTGQSSGASVGNEESGGQPSASKGPKIQVFEVDVKKIVNSSPLVTEFKNELPSVAKIEKTIELQQKAVQEGKVEKLEVEVVAVKGDGDLLVGAPKVETEEMVVFNRKGDTAGQTGLGDGMDIETAAGPGSGGPAPAPAPVVQSQPPPLIAPNLANIIGQVAGSVVTGGSLVAGGSLVTGGSLVSPALPPSQLGLTLSPGTGIVRLDRNLLAPGFVSFAGIPFPDLPIASGANTVSFFYDPKQFFFGFDSGMNLISSRQVTASLGDLSGSAVFNHDLAAIRAANPARLFLSGPSEPNLTALDAFFYFTGKVSGVADGPDRFFSDATVGGLARDLLAPGSPLELYAGQDWDFYAAQKYTQGGTDALVITPSGVRTALVAFASSIDLGGFNPRWQLNPAFGGSTPLGNQYLNVNVPYLASFDETIFSGSSEPVGIVDSFGGLISQLQNFPVWDDESGSLASADAVIVTLSGLKRWTLAAGAGGLTARGLDINSNGAQVELLSAGDLQLQASRITAVGDGTGSDETLKIEALGKVKLGADGAADLVTNAGIENDQQVRIEGQLDSGGNPFAGSLAVIRTGDSLELRNVTVRGFAETRLEKINPTTKTMEGRVLVSGSAVRDFKIKELVGAAVNADAKIQMMALDGTGALAGDMVVEGRMPVSAKIASALAEVGEILPAETAGMMVDAKQIDLAAGNLRFNNANLVAMNSITARANTILVQNSFMTVVRNQGMINLYVQSGLVNTTYGSMMDGRVNFAGMNQFTIGSTTSFAIGSQSQLDSAYGNTLLDQTHNGGSPQVGKVNVLKL